MGKKPRRTPLQRRLVTGVGRGPGPSLDKLPPIQAGSAAIIPGVEPLIRNYTMGRLLILVGFDPAVGWHLSISHPSRYPSWDEIKKARYELLPSDLTFGLILPPEGEYVNIHPFCFHLYEITARGER